MSCYARTPPGHTQTTSRTDEIWHRYEQGIEAADRELRDHARSLERDLAVSEWRRQRLGDAANDLFKESERLRTALTALAQSVAESQHAKPGTVLLISLERAFVALADPVRS